MEILNDTEFIKKIIHLLLEKGIIAGVIIWLGTLWKTVYERKLISEAFNYEISKVRVNKITGFFEMLCQYEHWLNRLMIHERKIYTEGKKYLTDSEYDVASKKSLEISHKISYELNQMRFWLTNDFYIHTVKYLDVLDNFRRLKPEDLSDELIKSFRYKMDATRLNIDSLLSYIEKKPKLRFVKYNRSPLYK